MAKKAQQAAKDAAAIEAAIEAIEALNKERTLHPDQTPNAHGEKMKASVAGEKCVVGFKVGIASLDLQLSRLEDKDEQTQTGVRTIKEAVRFGPVVRIRGTAYPRGVVPEGFPEKPLIVAGCAINPNVDKAFMREWLRLNATSAVVMNKMIFMADSEADAVAMARELSGELAGFDPINPKGDYRMPKSTNKAVGELEPGKAT